MLVWRLDVDVGALLAVNFAVGSRWGIGVIPWLAHQHLRCLQEYEAAVTWFNHDLSNSRGVDYSIFAKVRSVAPTAKYGTRDRHEEVSAILNASHHQRREASVLCALCGKGKKAGRRWLGGMVTGRGAHQDSEKHGTLHLDGE